MKTRLSGAAFGLTATLALAAASAGAAEVNVLPSATTAVTPTGVFGSLRAGSVWAPPGTLAAATTVTDGAFAPEGHIWDDGSVWWDQDSSINRLPPSIIIDLDHAYSFDRFVVQADDNDSYLLEYWNGSDWLAAFTVAPTFTYGLVTRDSGAITPITTDRLRFSATGGDNYYAVSEIQGFASVPEPTSWALMILGFGGLGAMLRRERRALSRA